MKGAFEAFAEEYHRLFSDARWVFWSGACALVAVLAYTLCKTVAFFGASVGNGDVVEGFLFGAKDYTTYRSEGIALFAAVAVIASFLFPRGAPRILFIWTCGMLVVSIYALK